MNQYIAYCGLNCEACEARLATIHHDDVLREKVAKLWSELNGVEITPEMIPLRGLPHRRCQNAVLRYAVSDPSVRSWKRGRNLRRLCRGSDLRNGRHDPRKQRRSPAESGDVRDA